MLTPSICADIFEKLIKTKPHREFTNVGNIELLYKLGDYELFVEIGPEFRIDYQVRMVITHSNME